MSYTTPQLDAAAAVAAMLTGREIAGFTITARSDLAPTYTAEDLRELKVDCMPVPLYEVTWNNRSSIVKACAVLVVVQMMCGQEDSDLLLQLHALMDGIVDALATYPAGDFGRPHSFDDVEWKQEHLIEYGQFAANVVANYRKLTEVSA